MKKLLVLCVVATALVELATAADAPKIEIFTGYSFLQVEGELDAQGFNISVAGNFNSWVGLVADYSHYDRSLSGPFPSVIQGRPQLILFGPRFTLRKGRLQPFVHTLVGAARFEVGAFGLSVSDSALAAAFGGGVDVGQGWFAGRLVQADYVVTRFFGESQNHLRLGVGVVFRFGKVR